MRLDRYVLIHGNCLEEMKRIPDCSVDMILCDLPYGTTACKWDIIIPFEPLWEQYKRVIKPNGAISLFGSQPFTSALVMSNSDMFKYEWIWEKSRGLGFTHVKNSPLKKHENILIFSKGSIKHIDQKGRMNYNPQDLKLLNKIVNGDKSCKADKSGHNFARPSNKIYTQEFTNYPSSILKFNNEGNTVHPTQKPVPLLEYLIKIYSNEDDIVLDSTMGSGSTGVAAANTNRKFIGIELDDNYYDIALNRVSRAFGWTDDREDIEELERQQENL